MAIKIPFDRRWLIVWGLIYAGFLILSIFAPDALGVLLLRCSGIALALVYVFMKFPQDRLLKLALGFTLAADILLAIDNVSVIGVAVFCFAQFFHFCRLRHTNPYFLPAYFVLVASVFTLSLVLGADPMFAVAGIYGLTLLSNVGLAIYWHHKAPSFASSCAMYGFILFLLCDLCVGASYLSNTAVFPSALYPFANYFAWAFYYPSQILLSNSSKLKKSVLQ
ncbi:hypothetical protein IJH02_02460 [Candidatus Saccharibacteria bacterium]|nr:hypothetical protein [Candidatus Saccharibacteria bacterium]